VLSFLNPLYHAVAVLLVGIHGGLRHVPLISGNSWSWSLSIVFLTIAMRLVLFPVFVKQIRTQRAMQVLQPKMKELQAKYKNDKEKLNQEMMALWKEHGANPLSGCLPLLLQIPIFISLFHTLRDIKATCVKGAGGVCTYVYKGTPGFSEANVRSAAHARILGAPIAAKFTSSTAFLAPLNGSHTATKILCLVLTVIMGATTFITQRQLMARNGPAANDQAAQTQKIMLYVFPLVFLFYGFKFPIGVLLYWLTTNVWSMVQQRVVINRMNPAPAAAGAATGDIELPPAGPLPGAKPKPAPRGPTPKAPPSGAALQLPPGGAIPATPPTNARPGGAKRPAGRSKNRKKGRR
jgi:YidC/Oxa1 family membrane protein insertase